MVVGSNVVVNKKKTAESTTTRRRTRRRRVVVGIDPKKLLLSLVIILACLTASSSYGTTTVFGAAFLHLPVATIRKTTSTTSISPSLPSSSSSLFLQGPRRSCPTTINTSSLLFARPNKKMEEVRYDTNNGSGPQGGGEGGGGTGGGGRRRQRRPNRNKQGGGGGGGGGSTTETSASSTGNPRRNQKNNNAGGAGDNAAPSGGENNRPQRQRRRPRRNTASKSPPPRGTDRDMMDVDNGTSSEAVTAGASGAAASPPKKAKKSRGSNNNKIIRPIRPTPDAMTMADSAREEQDAERNEMEARLDPTLLTGDKFADHQDIHPSSKRALAEILRVSSMTEIQSKTYHSALDGTDVLGRARTGTGKTLAFLLPSIERVLRHHEDNPTSRNNDVGILCLSPTRELANQIGVQAEKLVTYHPGLSVQIMYGGTKMGRDVTMLQRRVPTILVATPGRLLDHFENTKLNGGRSFPSIMDNLRVLILDETDRLLDMGFRRDILKIIGHLPKKQRQTLLFSATIPPEMKQVMSNTMRPGYITVDCIHDGGDSALGGGGGGQAQSQTNARVTQSYVILPDGLKGYVGNVLETIRRSMLSHPNDYKLVVFFPTARLVGYFAEVSRLALKGEGGGTGDVNIVEIHSRKSQSYRNSASDKFRSSRKAILFTSDVSARGVDYPDVTHVLQFGVPDSSETYIHRLGRTGRAGKQGQGLLVLANFEKPFVVNDLQKRGGFDVVVDEEFSSSLALVGRSSFVETKLGPILDKVANGDRDLKPMAEMAYQAFLGYYVGRMKTLRINSKSTVVEYANEMAMEMGLSEVPAIQSKTVNKMGLKGVKGVRVKANERR